MAAPLSALKPLDHGEPATEPRITAVRRFNRFYTPLIGLLDEGYLDSPWSLTQVRVLYELAQQETTTAAELAEALRLDAGYLSRILQGFKKRRLIEQKPSTADARRNILSLTAQGRRAFRPLDQRSRQQVAALLEGLSTRDQIRVVDAMRTIERVLGPTSGWRVGYVLRAPHAGEMGWVIQRHGALYAQEYGWNEEFEALVAGIVAKFMQQYDPRRERCWIADLDGEPVGSVFLVKDSERVARLRLMLVEPKARGFGIGTRLVDECRHFARSAGYQTIELWTNNVLHAARHIYLKAGFRLVREEPHHSFGHDLVGETWELTL